MKSRWTNFLEGLSLTATLQAFPMFTATAMLMVLLEHPSMVSDSGGAALYVATTSMLFALLTGWLGPKYPGFFRNSYAPLFFGALLTLRDKVSNWLALSATQQQVLTGMVMLALLGVAMVMRG